MRVSNLFSYVKLPWLPQLSLLIYCRQCHHYLHGRIEKTYMSFRQIKVKFANAMNSVYVFFNFSKSSKVLAHIRKILPINLRWSKVRFWITRVDVLEQPPEVLHKKKLFLKFFQYSHENTCVGVSFLQSCRLSGTATQVLFCEYNETLKNSYFEEHLRTVAPVYFYSKAPMNILS